MTRAEILEIQRQLGLKRDGIYGPKTHDAYQRWLDANTVESMPTPAPAAAKPWWQSRAVLGILVSLIAVITERMGWTVDANTLAPLAVQFAEVAGLALAFLGTVRRRAPIDHTLVVPGVRFTNTAYPLPPDGPADKPAGPFGY
jgi:hypothetical protein